MVSIPDHFHKFFKKEVINLMCGISGEIRFDGKTASVDRVGRMLRHMQRRGPDAGGVIAHNNVALGHRRLKIIDLSEKAQQPMSDPHLGLTLVFNGCIYNHKEIRTRLESKGYRFFSNSDTEIILKSYHAWGDRCVEEFNGMFAIAIHERDTGKIFLARDRLGIKPLYYYKSPGVLRFASSMPALVKSMQMKPDIDPVSLHYYMTFHSVIPAPRTIFDQISKIPPGMTYTFDKTGMYKERRYWDINNGYKLRNELPEDENQLIEILLDKLRISIKRRTESDVPVGVLLSGGVDSSMVVSLLAGTGYTDLKTFSVGFDDTPEEDGNEFRYSDLIANEYRTEHHRFRISSEEIVENLPDCLMAMSEPMVSHDNIGFYLLGKKVSEHVKVVQSGQGADELFGGYHWYQSMQESHDPVADYSRAFFDRDHNEYQEAVTEKYVKTDFSREFVKNQFSRAGAVHPVDKALKLDTSVMLVDDPVKRVDNMTMAWGLEARVPFLDHEVAEFAASIPPEFKMRNGGKYILKEAARRIIPEAVIDRPKGYFPVPALKYLRGSVLEYVKDALSNQAARERNIFRKEYIEKLFKDPVAHITPLKGSKLWQAATLELWMQSHDI
jgi:asparagine synthase (glutamine-hydrolysing)